ncbi:MAG TPA: carbon storage regulator CsrA [Bacillota bacterium]|nr:carbon storage regulator CsrA [Bacillota bacterium]
MLVLTRRIHESIQIGDEIEVKVLAVEGDQIKIGIDAPMSVEIHRKEIYLAIQQQNSEAANTPTHLLELLQDR